MQRPPIHKRSQAHQPLRRGHLVLGLTVPVLIFMIMAGCRGGTESSAPARPLISGVSVSMVQPTEVEQVIEATGTVRSESTSLIASRVMGVITALKVREGDMVEPGQVLLTLDDRDAVEREKAAVMAVQSAGEHRDLAEATWRRYRNLYDQKALSEQEMDQVSAQRRVAQAEYARAVAMAAEARTYLGFTRITAPTAGRVAEKRVDAGSMAAPGMPLLVLESGGDAIIEAAVDESLITKIETGLPVTVLVDALSLRLTGAVKEILPTIDAVTRTFTVKIAVKDKRLRSGLFARVRLPLGKRMGLMVSESAIVQKGALTGVYVVDPAGVVTYRLIRTGIRTPNGIEVLSGLKARDRIISGGVEKAVDGGMLAGGQVQ